MSVDIIGQVETLHRSPEHLSVEHFDVTMAVCFANSRETLGETIRSLAAQVHADPFELLLVSNGTTDDSVEVAEEHSRGMAVRIFRCENAGYDANARNVSMLEAAGDKLLFLDADDTVGPGYVTEMVSALEAAPLVTSMWELNQLNPDRMAGLSQRTEAITLLPFRRQGWPYAAAGTLGMRREVPSSIGGFDPALQYAANNEWCFRAYAAGIEMRPVPGAAVHVRLRADLSGSLRQRFRWGFWEVAAERVAVGYGLPRTTGMSIAKRYRGLVRSSLRVRTRHHVQGLVISLAHAGERIVGSLQVHAATWRPGPEATLVHQTVMAAAPEAVTSASVRPSHG